MAERAASNSASVTFPGASVLPPLAHRPILVKPSAFANSKLAGVYSPRTPSFGCQEGLAAFAAAVTAATPASKLRRLIALIEVGSARIISFDAHALNEARDHGRSDTGCGRHPPVPPGPRPDPQDDGQLERDHREIAGRPGNPQPDGRRMWARGTVGA